MKDMNTTACGWLIFDDSIYRILYIETPDAHMRTGNLPE